VRRLGRARRKEALYQRAIDRLDGKWRGKGLSGDSLQPTQHLYGADLDLFGDGSLFELLCEARTLSGEQALARWMCEPADLATILARQQAVRALRPSVQLREDLQLAGDAMRSELDPGRLCQWAEAGVIFSAARAKMLRLCAASLALANIFALCLWAFVGPAPFVIAAVATFLLQRTLGPSLQRIAATVDRASAQLELLTAITSRLQHERFHTPYLQRLHGELVADACSASAAISKLTALVSWLDSLKNAFFAPVGWVLLLPLQLALSVERWRALYGRRVTCWLAALGELEALCSLSAYAYEHPHDPFAEFDEDTASILVAEDLRHPLLEGCIPNSLVLAGETRAFVVSGSNMSGKSTLLRTVGINVVLARLGAPVPATSLRLTPLEIVATMRVHDSLRDGESRFYAEIVRLKKLFDLVELARKKEGPPVLFLLDELLHGTNSHDRKVGAMAIVTKLVEAGAIGLVATHDLSLSVFADQLTSLDNVHFIDEVREGALHFDYTLKPGVVTKSNALELMRAAGLPV